MYFLICPLPFFLISWFTLFPDPQNAWLVSVSVYWGKGRWGRRVEAYWQIVLRSTIPAIHPTACSSNTKCICPSCKKYLSKLQNVFVQIQNVFVQMVRLIDRLSSARPSRLYIQLPARQIQNVFVQVAKSICPNDKMYFIKIQNVFVQIIKCICPN